VVSDGMTLRVMVLPLPLMNICMARQGGEGRCGRGESECDGQRVGEMRAETETGPSLHPTFHLRQQVWVHVVCGGVNELSHTLMSEEGRG